MIKADLSPGREQNLEVERILPNPGQPRRTFRQAQLEQLAASISSQGVIQPLIVRRHPHLAETYELIAGERRLRAIRLLGWREAPALIRDIPDERLMEAALVENLQREQLSPIEEGQAYQTLLRRFGYTQETLAGRVGKDRSTIANTIRLLSLPPALQRDLDEEKLTAGHGRALLMLDNDEARLALRDQIIAGNLSVRETERMVSRHRRERKDGPRAAVIPMDPKLKAAQDQLERNLGTRVRILPGPGGQGRIELEYYSLDDLNRLYDLLRG